MRDRGFTGPGTWILFPTYIDVIVSGITSTAAGRAACMQAINARGQAVHRPEAGARQEEWAWPRAGRGRLGAVDPCVGQRPESIEQRWCA